MSFPKPVLAHTLINPKKPNDGFVVDPSGWYASEKLDGERAVWNGQELITRNGNIIHAPQWFIDPLPKDVFLDGELHCGRGQFQKTMSVARKKIPVDDEWKMLKYSVFDTVPSSLGKAGGIVVDENLTYEQRLQLLKRVFRRKHLSSVPWIKTCWQTKIRASDAETHLNEMMSDVVGKGGEGLIVRDPDAPYEFGKRSHRVLKLKDGKFDEEAEIIGYVPGNGRNAGKLGAFRCRMISTAAAGTAAAEFNVSGMTDDVRDSYKQTHPIGTVITYKHAGLTLNGVPRHPVYLRIRTNRC